ncbi:preprotein translocase subunit YajC [Opitutaceae bacterium EW11]|nr:preprotein translocase subunit YajC [Opitutaceae bacterium EW11]
MTKIAPLFDASSFLAQAAAPASGPSGAQGLMGFLPIILMMAGFWFLVIAPQRKKQKQLQKSIDALEAGDEVMTSGGIFGEITNKKQDRFVVRIADNTKVEVGRGFIQAVVKKADGSDSAKK